MSTTQTAPCIDGRTIAGGLTLEEMGALRDLGTVVTYGMACSPADVVHVVRDLLHADVSDLAAALKRLVAALDVDAAAVLAGKRARLRRAGGLRRG